MGSIEERKGKTGTSWRVSWDLPKALQELTQAKKGHITVATKKDAERINTYVKSIRHKITSEQAEAWFLGLEMPPAVAEKEEPEAAPGVTIREWIPRYLRIKSGGKAQANTVDTYESQLSVFADAKYGDSDRKYGDLKLDEVTGEDIMSFFTAIKQRPGRAGREQVTNSTVDHYYAVLSNFWRVAVDNEIVARNPVTRSGWTKGVKDEDYEGADEKADEYFEPEQYAKLLSLIRPDFLLFVRFLGETGVRFSEATALRVGDLNFETNKAHIRRAWKKKYSGGRLSPGETKGRQRRWVEVTVEVMVLLAEHVKNKNPDEYIFTSPTGKVISHSNFRNRQWIPAMIKARQCSRHLPTRIDGRNGLEVFDPHSPSSCTCLGEQPWTNFTPHALRHTYATWCILDPQCSLTLLSIQLGHKDTRTTENIYMHVRTKVAGLGLAASIGRTLNHHLNEYEGPKTRHLVAV